MTMIVTSGALQQLLLSLLLFGDHTDMQVSFFFEKFRVALKFRQNFQSEPEVPLIDKTQPESNPPDDDSSSNETLFGIIDFLNWIIKLQIISEKL